MPRTNILVVTAAAAILALAATSPTLAQATTPAPAATSTIADSIAAKFLQLSARLTKLSPPRWVLDNLTTVYTNYRVNIAMKTSSEAKKIAEAAFAEIETLIADVERFKAMTEADLSLVRARLDAYSDQLADIAATVKRLVPEVEQLKSDRDRLLTLTRSTGCKAGQYIDRRTNTCRNAADKS